MKLFASWSKRNIPRKHGRPYLERIGREQSLEQAREDKATGKWRARIHHFVGIDDAGHHNHPFRWSFSIVLSALWGAYYTEEVFHTYEQVADNWPGDRVFDWAPVAGGFIETRRVRFFNWIPMSKYHRIIETHGDVWTLFVTGPRVQSWGFWVPGRGHIHHNDYNREIGNNEREELE